MRAMARATGHTLLPNSRQYVPRDWSATIPVSRGSRRKYTSHPAKKRAAAMGSIQVTKVLALTAPPVAAMAIYTPVKVGRMLSVMCRK